MKTTFLLFIGSGGFQGGSAVKNPPASAENMGSIRGLGRSPGGGNRPTPVFFPGKSHEQRNLAGYSPWRSQRVRHDLATKQQHRNFPEYKEY